MEKILKEKLLKLSKIFLIILFILFLFYSQASFKKLNEGFGNYNNNINVLNNKIINN